jgi:hypothetical protein
MRKPGGYALIVSPEPGKVNFDRFWCADIPAGVSEFDTFTCGHCGCERHVKAMAPMDEFGSMCRNCMKMVCPKCADGPCVPFEKKLQMIEDRERTLRSYGLL